MAFGQIPSNRLYLRPADAPRTFLGAIPSAELPTVVITIGPIDYQPPSPVEHSQPVLPIGIVVVPPIDYPN